MPPVEPLAQLLRVALVKKQGVLQQPPACWSSDPKINPDSVHLVWAAVLNGRQEELISAEALVINEFLARPSRQEVNMANGKIQEILRDLPNLAPTQEFHVELLRKVETARRMMG
ncbi:MAG: hypothetical protein KJ950_12280 [Proteobacteria bacterium]|nr:hypothetical protein [Pseudomonadota bacterium]MBU1688109.1 hypothetical protein [Pseudomonadota bacterium]